jgi:hypothetical protein
LFAIWPIDDGNIVISKTNSVIIWAKKNTTKTF